MTDDYESLLGALAGAMGHQEEKPVSKLCLPDKIDVAAIRKKAGLSQPAFASCIGVPVATIRNWEQGHRTPKGPAKVLLALLERNPRIVQDTLRGW